MPLRILVIAYEFNPKVTPLPSAPGGLRAWKLVNELRRFCAVTVLTSSRNHVEVVDAVSTGTLPGLSVHFVEEAHGTQGLPERHLRGAASYYRWQRRALKTALRLHEERPFDAGHFMPPDWDSRPPRLSPELPFPQIWGPVPPALQIPPALKRKNVPGRILAGGRRFLSGIEGGRIIRLRQIERIEAVLLCDPAARQKFPREAWKRLRFFPFGGVHGNEVTSSTRSSEPRPFFNVLAAGNLRLLDGYSATIQAFVSLIQAGIDAVLVIVSGNREARLRSLIGGHGLDSRISLLGRLPLDELRRRLRETDLFVLPDFDPAAAPLCVHALASGVPVMAFAGGGGDVFLQQDWGVKLSWTNERQVVRDMTEAMRRHAAHAGRRREMGRAARRYVREHLIWKRQGETLEDLYAELFLQGENIRVGETEKGRFFY